MGFTIVARAPNHLGDGIMAIPALAALAKASSSLTIHAPGFGAELYRDVPATIAARGEMLPADVAVLFPPSFRAAWEARRSSRRVGVAGDFRRFLLTDVVAEGPHRRDTYAALARAVGALVVGEPTYARWPSDPLPDVPDGHVGLNPVSVSGAVVEWKGFRGLADHLHRPIVFYGGPGENERVAMVAGPYPRRVGLSLVEFAGALSKCAVFVSNDSGAAHFARACGVQTVVVFGSTTAACTGPAGAIAVEGPNVSTNSARLTPRCAVLTPADDTLGRPTGGALRTGEWASRGRSGPCMCRPCYRKRCKRELECLNIPVERVLAAVEQALALSDQGSSRE